MRPLEELEQPESFNPPTHLTFSKANGSWLAILRLLGGKGTLSDTGNSLILLTTKFLKFLVTISPKANPRRNAPARERHTDDERAIWKMAFGKKLSEIWGKADSGLKQGWGSYCAFCEENLHSSIAVEHIVPKASYPRFVLEWTNYLPTCGPCNTAKGVKPSPAVVNGWDDTDWAQGDWDDQLEFRDAILDHYSWPNRDSEVFQKFPISVEINVDDDGFEPLTLLKFADCLECRLHRKEEDTGVVWVTVEGIDAPVPAQVYTRSESGTDLDQLCALNRVIDPPEDSADDEELYDRRVYWRTLAWTSALTAALNYELVRSDAAAEAAMNVIITAADRGFWSVWVTILSQYLEYGTEDALADAFIDGLSEYRGTSREDIELDDRVL